jgi:hypothetical protein
MSKEWKLVPVEPTEEMLRSAADHEIGKDPEYDEAIADCLKSEWSAMLAAAPVPLQSDVQPAAWIKPDVLATLRGDECCYAFGEQSPKGNLVPLFTRSDAGEVERLNTVVEQQKNLIASLRAELRDAYSIDAAVQEDHLDLEAAAKKLAACMDYPWEHMPEQGRASMREHAKAIVSAALSASAEAASHYE